MQRLNNIGGYTIVETMIFLAVSGLIFASVVVSMSAQNRRTQFTTSVNNFNQSIQDILNDVDDGYFPSNGDFSCSVNASGELSFSAVVGGNISNNLGKNADCIYAGKAISIDTSDSTRYTVQNLVGRRQITGTSKEVANVADAKIMALPTDVSGASASDSGSLDSDVHLIGIRAFNDNSYSDSTAVDKLGIITSFGQEGGVGTTSLKNGSINSNLMVFGSGAWSPANNGVVLCLAEGGNISSGRTATIRIGAGTTQGGGVVAIDNYEGCRV